MLHFQAREKDATQYEQEVGNKMAATLRILLQPYFLRRTKDSILKTNKENEHKEGKQVEEKGANEEAK